jgi:prepilin-type processing-associated H-X9-DG protein
MEILVVIAIILVLAAIALPVMNAIRTKANKQVAMANMSSLGTALAAYCNSNDGTLPNEDGKGVDTWQVAADPETAKAWYNALPKLAGHKSVGEFATTPRDFYSKENLLWLPGATYPKDGKELAQPLFAIAMNTKLQRKGEDDKKEPVKLSQITHAAKTVAFLEQGIKGETQSMKVQPAYDGSCKGSAKSFVARYGGQGVLLFFDGHVESFETKDLLTETGKIVWTQGEMPPVVWCLTPEQDPNK